MNPLLAREQRVAWAGAAGLVAAMGVGRFAFTPLLPLMTDAGAIDHSQGAMIATANYAGYLLGAVALSIRPGINTSAHLRVWAVALVASELAMAMVSGVAAFAVARLVAGVASAVIFVGCLSTVAAARRRGASSSLAFSGVGVGIVISGVVASVAGPVLTWREMWVLAAVITALVLTPVAMLRIRPEGARVVAPQHGGTRSHAVAWRLLLVTYFLEGLGYIVIGTFLVAAISGEARGSGADGAGPLAWIVVGVFAVPAVLFWSWVSQRLGAHRTLGAALGVQVVAAVLPAVSPSPVAAMVAAALFGGTFIGIVSVAMTVGAQLPVARTAAILTAVYGVGQMLGPLVVAPVLGSSFTLAFAIAAVVLTVATAAAIGVAITMPGPASSDPILQVASAHLVAEIPGDPVGGRLGEPGVDLLQPTFHESLR
ncbi:YbfB/YjiJ family MFS transporter [Williamsia sp. CHRR-6]|uniref:YbfB/YjiJ family MFS transporter n=1 Tax=Williamsia sp. CHRR-6 TaxID=2835871 RepID=UPI0027DB5BC3|nr:YbfB/YjiJ family MFS transporter [Williamsia sp. CHRR-6]